MINPFHYVYGPVYSWRLGNSLGVDPLSTKEKICNMNCTYCQLGRTIHLTQERKEYVGVPELIAEIKRIPLFFVDYITFSGRGEPTLAKNLGDMIRAVKAIRHEKIAVITNSSLMHVPSVQQDLNEADFVLAKLDAASQEGFNCVDGVCGIDFDQMLKGIADFRQQYKGKFALQIMLMEDNLDQIKEISTLVHLFSPDEVQLNTPIRPSASAPLEKSRLDQAKKFFKGIHVVTCYDAPKGKTQPMDEQSTVSRHGNYRKSRYAY